MDPDPVDSGTFTFAEQEPDPESIPDPDPKIKWEKSSQRNKPKIFRIIQDHWLTCLVGDVERGFIVESSDNREDGVQAREGAPHHHHLDRLAIHVRYRRNGTHRTGFNFKVIINI